MGKKSVRKICFCLAMMCIDGAGDREVEREKCDSAGAGNERELQRGSKVSDEKSSVDLREVGFCLLVRESE